MTPRTAGLLALLLALPAFGQEEPGVRPQRLYLNPSGVLLGSARVVALGGAFVGVAEGAAGFPTNLAALAHRSAHLDRDWDVGFTASWLDLPFVSPSRRDLDNDGVPDQAMDSQQFLGGLMLQYKQFGIGWYLRDTWLTYCKLHQVACQPGVAQDRIAVHLSNTALGAAVALGRDDLIVALGLYGTVASFGTGREAKNYGDTGLELDLLYRPHGLNYRVGVSVRPQVVGFYRPDPGDGAFLGERQLYSAVVSPAVLSLGASMRLGPGSDLYNRYSKAARRDLARRFGEAWAPEDLPDEALAGSWMITAQLDFISSTENTVPISAFTDLDVQLGVREPELIGREAYLAPHLGAEHDTIPGRLRTRIGTFIEPTPFRGRGPRVHGTCGVEVFLYEYLDKWSLAASGDFAQHYYNVGLSLGFWR